MNWVNSQTHLGVHMYNKETITYLELRKTVVVLGKTLEFSAVFFIQLSLGETEFLIYSMRQL